MIDCGVEFEFFENTGIVSAIPQKHDIGFFSFTVFPVFGNSFRDCGDRCLFADDEVDFKSKYFFEEGLDVLCECFGRCFFMFKKYVSGVDVGAYVFKTEGFEGGFEFFHVNAIISADVDASQERNGLHMGV